ncbi:MAG: antibiotic biosynthesis monooxygenase [Bacteroidota bacterium]
MIAKTPKPPYFAVIFTSVRTDGDNGYTKISERMIALARKQDGFLGAESARNEVGITVSYWNSLEAIKNWKENLEHLEAQKAGKEKWYKIYKVRVAKVEYDYDFLG